MNILSFQLQPMRVKWKNSIKNINKNKCPRPMNTVNTTSTTTMNQRRILIPSFKNALNLNPLFTLSSYLVWL